MTFDRPREWRKDSTQIKASCWLRSPATNFIFKPSRAADTPSILVQLSTSHTRTLFPKCLEERRRSGLASAAIVPTVCRAYVVYDGCPAQRLFPDDLLDHLESPINFLALNDKWRCNSDDAVMGFLTKDTEFFQGFAVGTSG